MQTRNKGFDDYGLDLEDAKAMKEFCKIFEQNSEADAILSEVICEVKPDLATYLYTSLREGISYDELSKIDYVPIGKNDFYGWRRRIIFEFYSKYFAKCMNPPKEEE